MIEGLLGRKIGMTQVFSEVGEAIPVTVIEVGPCVVTQIRNKERDGYEAVQLGFGEVKPKSLTKPEQGHLAGAGRLVRHLREFDADNIEDHQVGQVLSADVFEPGQIIDVTGTSKGRGFQGVASRVLSGATVLAVARRPTARAIDIARRARLVRAPTLVMFGKAREWQAAWATAA
jgi:large subunit ribosomal protein L3